MKFLKKPYISQELVVFLAALVLVFAVRECSSENELPVYQPSYLNPALVDVSKRAVFRDHRVAEFKLINQDGDTITQNDYNNHIYVADFFFTRCPSICPIMTNNMAKLQARFMDNEQVKFLSISVTPEFDSVAVLKEYAIKKGAITSKWNITTGTKKHIYDLARKSYFAVNDEGDGALQEFIHTPNFVLVDTSRRIRGIYDGTKDEEIIRLTKDIRRLQD